MSLGATTQLAMAIGPLLLGAVVTEIGHYYKMPNLRANDIGCCAVLVSYLIIIIAYAAAAGQ